MAFWTPQDARDMSKLGGFGSLTFGLRSLFRADQRVALIAVVASVVGWVALRRNVLSDVDIGLHDETNSLAAGIQFLRHGTLDVHPASSPLYAVWYAFWFWLSGDPLTTYYVQWLATDLMLFVVVLISARAWGMGPLGGPALALAFAASEIPSVGWPRVYLLALVFVLLGHLAARSSGRAWLGGMGLVAAAGVRPEYQFSLVVWLFLELRGRVPSRYRTWLVGAALVGLSVMVIALPWGSGRMWIAFSQHFALRYSEQHPLALVDPWNQAPEWMARVLPGVHSLGQALRESPGVVLSHVGQNLIEYPKVLIQGMTHWPHAGAPLAQWGGLVLLTLAVVVGTVRGIRSRPSFDPAAQSRKFSKADRRLFLAATASVLPSVWVMPKATYALALVLAGLAMIMAMLAWAWQRWLAGRVPSILAACAFAGLALAPWFLPRPAAPRRGCLVTLMELQRVWQARPLADTWRMLEADGGWCVYLDVDDCRRVAHDRKADNVSWSSFVQAENINAIVVTPRLSQAPAFHSDPEFIRFLSNPEMLGFQLSMNNGWARLFLRR